MYSAEATLPNCVFPVVQKEKEKIKINYDTLNTRWYKNNFLFFMKYTTILWKYLTIINKLKLSTQYSIPYNIIHFNFHKIHKADEMHLIQYYIHKHAKMLKTPYNNNN